MKAADSKKALFVTMFLVVGGTAPIEAESATSYIDVRVPSLSEVTEYSNYYLKGTIVSREHIVKPGTGYSCGYVYDLRIGGSSNKVTRFFSLKEHRSECFGSCGAA
jgi:hypothetical protein